MWLPFCIFSVQFIELVLRNAALWWLGESWELWVSIPLKSGQM